MRVQGGLKQEDWQRWGQFTTYKSNAAELLGRALRPDMMIYCSPLVDPYQPAEASESLMPGLLRVLASHPPKLFVIQTRSPLILRDLSLLQAPGIRVSFSITTNRDEIRRLYEPLCEPFEARLNTLRQLTRAGIPTFATVAPILPCDPEELIAQLCAATPLPLIADPLHLRAAKAHGATTRGAAFRVAGRHGHSQWIDAGAQTQIVERLRTAAAAQGRSLATGPEGFRCLTTAVTC